MRSDSLARILFELTDRLKALPLTGDRDVDIVTELIEHHKATIQMDLVLVRDGDDEKLKEFAERLTAIQEEEIGNMQEFLDHHPSVNGTGKRGKPELATQLHAMAPTDDVDAAYVSFLRMHLNYGIALARKEHERGLHDDMKQLAGEIVRSGEKMVAELEDVGASVTDR